MPQQQAASGFAASQVSWSGVTNATEADVIALFVPASQSVDTMVPTKWKWVNQVAGWESGSGSLTFVPFLPCSTDALLYTCRALSHWLVNNTRD